jgi:hypothetical protein
MTQYLLPFIVGELVVTAVVYAGNHGGGIMAALVANVPVLFLTNVLFLYHSGGLTTSINYIKGVLFFLPAFTTFAALTLVLLPQMSLVKTLLIALPIYSLALIVGRRLHQKISAFKELQQDKNAQGLYEQTIKQPLKETLSLPKATVSSVETTDVNIPTADLDLSSTDDCSEKNESAPIYFQLHEARDN